MNIFAGSFSLKDTTTEIENSDFDLVSAENGTYFCMGEIELGTSKEVLEYFTKEFGEILCYDISISTEDEIEICSEEYFTDGVYECVSFEGASIDIETLSERFEWVDEVISIRQAEQSKRHNNRIIKVDFLY